MFNGYRVSGNARVRLMVRKYNKRFFPFYSSYAGKGGDEREVDRRFNVWKSPLFLIGMPCAVLLVGGGMWGVVRFLTQAKAPKVEVTAKQEKSGGMPAQKPVAPVSEWRSVGVISDGDTASYSTRPSIESMDWT
jgi:hypothetical protein